MYERTCQDVKRLARWSLADLGLIVLEAAAGRDGDLREYVIGVQVFGKEASFDPRTDPIVRAPVPERGAHQPQHGGGQDLR